MFWRGLSTTAGGRVTWTVIEPNDGLSSSALPALPAGHAAENPTLDPALDLKGTAVIYDAFDTPGFVFAPPTGAYRSRTTSSETYNLHLPF